MAVAVAVATAMAISTPSEHVRTASQDGQVSARVVTSVPCASIAA